MTQPKDEGSTPKEEGNEAPPPDDSARPTEGETGDDEAPEAPAGEPDEPADAEYMPRGQHRPADEAASEKAEAPEPAMLMAPPAAPPLPDTRPAGPDPYGAPPDRGFHLSDLLITFVLRWRLLALLLVAPAALGIGGAFLLTPRYTADSVLLVQVSREAAGAPDLTGFGPSVVTVEMLKVARAEIEILRSAGVLRQALRQVGPGRLFPGSEEAPEGSAAFDKAVERLQAALKADADTTSNVLRLSLTLPDREMAVEGLQAILDAYLERRTEMFRDDSARFLETEVRRYGERIREIEARIMQVRARFGVIDITQEIQLTASRREELTRREAGLREQMASAQAQRSAAEAALSAEPGRVFSSSEATNLVPNDDSRNQLVRLLAERERMAAQYAPDYPGLRELDARIAAARNAAREASRATFSTTRQVRNPNIELLSQRVVTLRLEEEAVQRQREEVAQQLQEALARGNALLLAERELRDLGREREGMEGILRQLTTREAGSRIDEEARRKRGPGIQVVQAPTAPVDGRSLRRLVAAGGVAGGMGLAGAALLLLTLTRRVFATPREAERGLTLPVLASFGNLAPAAQKMRSQPEVEDVTALLKDARVDGKRPALVQLVGTGEADGRDLLARSIAIALARRSTSDILLLDLQTDGRAHLAALGAQPMEVERIPGEVLVFNTVLPNLWISHEAANSTLTSALVTREQTDNLLWRLRQAFETIIIIGPDDTESYAMRRLTAMVDVNVVVVRGEQTPGARARQMRDWVLGSGGALLGFVFTGRRKILPSLLARFV